MVNNFTHLSTPCLLPSRRRASMERWEKQAWHELTQNLSHTLVLQVIQTASDNMSFYQLRRPREKPSKRQQLSSDGSLGVQEVQLLCTRSTDHTGNEYLSGCSCAIFFNNVGNLREKCCTSCLNKPDHAKTQRRADRTKLYFFKQALWLKVKERQLQEGQGKYNTMGCLWLVAVIYEFEFFSFIWKSKFFFVQTRAGTLSR